MRIGDRREAPGPQIQMSVEQIQKDVPEQIDSAMKTTGNGDGIPCPAIGKAQIFAVAFCTELLESGVPDATAGTTASKCECPSWGSLPNDVTLDALLAGLMQSSCIVAERFRTRSVLCEVRPPRAAVLVRSGQGAQGHRAEDLQLRAAAHAHLPRELDGLLLDVLLDVCSGTARRVLEA